MRAFHDRLGHLYHFRNVLQKCCACPAASDGFYRASIVDVDEVWIDGGGNLGGTHHVSDVASEKLYADGAFILENVELLSAFGRVTDQALGRNEFGVHQVGAACLANRAEWRVADILHRCQQQREFTQRYVTDFY